jgi:hypothetical protein
MTAYFFWLLQLHYPFPGHTPITMLNYNEFTLFACLIIMLSPRDLIDLGRAGPGTCLLESATLPVFRIVLSLV